MKNYIKRSNEKFYLKLLYWCYIWNVFIKIYKFLWKIFVKMMIIEIVRVWYIDINILFIRWFSVIGILCDKKFNLIDNLLFKSYLFWNNVVFLL